MYETIYDDESNIVKKNEDKSLKRILFVCLFLIGLINNIGYVLVLAGA